MRIIAIEAHDDCEVIGEVTDLTTRPDKCLIQISNAARIISNIPITELGQMDSGTTVEKLRKNIAFLLKMLGDSAVCQCGREFWWVVHPRTKNKMPITGDALSHWADCPLKEKFRKEKKDAQ